MGIRDSFRRANETVADSAAEIDRGRAARRAAVDRAKTTTTKAAKAVTTKTDRTGDE
ncbi:hypothetical protein [Amycolatopsis lexingtonensis]|uniref:hypothetical protein n=1 Tax=Amycolatopsis lexingtonensis TaxID=218822 RepID=UPI003F727A42